MDKKDILSAFNGVIESTALWDEMASILFSLGAEIFETKYAESLQIHQELVWKMIINYRKYPDLNEEEFIVFIDTLYDLGRKKPFIYEDEKGAHVLTDREQILDLFLAPDFFLHETIELNPQFLENF